jgi:hypothetical protein
MEPKSIPKRFKIEVDFQERGNTLQDRLGTVLEPSWADLGPSSPGLGPSWGDLGPAGGAKTIDFPYDFHYF